MLINYCCCRHCAVTNWKKEQGLFPFCKTKTGEEKRRTEKGKKGSTAASTLLPERPSVPIATCFHRSRRRQRNPTQGFI
ncbi:hypothetical protein AAC387_Pa07g0210 [Persea americana]